MRHGEIHCQSCSIQCRILPTQEFSASQCFNARVCIWPEINLFFEVGIKSVINSVGIITSSKGFVFVDFSWRNIRFFMNDGWVEYLQSTKMKVILLSDKKMAPLASYYKQNEVGILDVLYMSEGLRASVINVRKLFTGLPLFRQSVRALTKRERDVLYLTLNQRKAVDIAEEMSLDTKSVYNIRQRIENKMGMKIRRFS